MSAEIGTLIKKARTSAGLTQAELAEKLDGITATDISKAERGVSDLTPDQLKAIASAAGVAPELLADEPAPKAIAEPAVPAVGEGELLELYLKADAEAQKAAVALLKGENPYLPVAVALLGKITKTFAQKGANPVAGILGGLKGFIDGSIPVTENPVGSILTGVMSIVGGAKSIRTDFVKAKAEKAPADAKAPANAKSSPAAVETPEKKKAAVPMSKRTISQPLLAFTFFYAVAIYILLLSFYF